MYVHTCHAVCSIETRISLYVNLMLYYVDCFLCMLITIELYLQVGAAFQPNPGECNLEPDESGGQEFYEYTKDRVYVCYYIGMRLVLHVGLYSIITTSYK